MAKVKSQKPKAKTRGPRRLKPPKYSHFRLSKRLKHPGPTLISSWRLFGRSLKLLKSRPRLFGGIILTYGLLTILLVKGLSSGLDIAGLKAAVKETLGGGFNQLSTSLALFGYLITNASQQATSEAGAAYGLILTVIVSLALIWALRQTSANKNLSVKEAFYKGIYPVVPFVLVLLVIGLELIPIKIGNTIFDLAINQGFAVTAIEKFLWGLAFFLLAVFSFYMLSSSLFALYIVTLPDMTPMRALRSARQLVLYRRWVVLRRLVMLPLFLAAAALIIMLPIILYLPVVAEWALFALGMVVLAVVHAYIYTLYRELL